MSTSVEFLLAFFISVIFCFVLVVIKYFFVHVHVYVYNACTVAVPITMVFCCGSLDRAKQLLSTNNRTMELS